VTKYYGPGGEKVTKVLETTRIAYDNLDAGEPVAQYDTLFLDGEFVRVADAGDPAKMPVVGMAFQGGAVSGGNLDVLIKGIVSNSNWNFTSNDVIFASAASNGLITNTPPTTSGQFVQRLGISRTPDSMEFSPENNYVRIAASN
jgi:hypothetical protein